MHYFSDFILINNSTCFGQIECITMHGPLNVKTNLPLFLYIYIKLSFAAKLAIPVRPITGP